MAIAPHRAPFAAHTVTQDPQTSSALDFRDLLGRSASWGVANWYDPIRKAIVYLNNPLAENVPVERLVADEVRIPILRGRDSRLERRTITLLQSP